MTLAPLIAPEIRGRKGKPPQRYGWCSVPGCIARSQEGHHIWSRSHLGGQPQDWVELPSGNVMANITGLCVPHHRDVSSPVGGHKAWIRLEAGDVLVWYARSPDGSEWEPVGPLFPQPHSERRPAPTDTHVAKAHVHLEPGDTCESCGYTKPAKREALPQRKSATWGVVVPDDSEIGSEVLDEWVDQFAVLLGFGDEPSRLKRYHVLAAVLAWAMQNKQLFVEDVFARGET